MLILGISVCVFEDESPYVSCRRGCYCRKRFKAKALGLPLCCCQREILEKHHPLCLYTRPFAACGMKTYLLSFALLSLVFQPLQDSGPLTLETADLPWLCVCSGALPREGGKEREKRGFLPSSALVWPLLGSSCCSRLSALRGSSIPSRFAPSHPFSLSVSCRALILLSFVP